MILQVFSIDGHSPAPVCVTEPPATWQAICQIEPHLIGLKREAKRCRGRDWHAYERLKSRLEKLAGWGAAQPALRSSEAFDVAHRAVLGGFQ